MLLLLVACCVLVVGCITLFVDLLVVVCWLAFESVACHVLIIMCCLWFVVCLAFVVYCCLVLVVCCVLSVARRVVRCFFVFVVWFAYVYMVDICHILFVFCCCACLVVCCFVFVVS